MSQTADRIASLVMEQLDGLPVRSIRMMGGWLFYVEERIFGGIYDSEELMVRITDTSRRFLPDSLPEPPYPGAKPMLPCTILDDRDKLRQMVMGMCPELPARKPNKK